MTRDTVYLSVKEAARRYGTLDPAYISVKEATRRYGICRAKFYQLTKMGVFLLTKCGRRSLVHVQTNDARFAQYCSLGSATEEGANNE